MTTSSSEWGGRRLWLCMPRPGGRVPTYMCLAWMGWPSEIEKRWPGGAGGGAAIKLFTQRRYGEQGVAESTGLRCSNCPSPILCLCTPRGLERQRPPSPSGPADHIRLFDIVHSDSKLYLVFEFLDLDLKRYMDSIGDKDGLGPNMVRVGTASPASPFGVSFLPRTRVTRPPGFSPRLPEPSGLAARPKAALC
jgi:hypothetical protein